MIEKIINRIKDFRERYMSIGLHTPGYYLERNTIFTVKLPAICVGIMLAGWWLQNSVMVLSSFIILCFILFCLGMWKSG